MSLSRSDADAPSRVLETQKAVHPLRGAENPAGEVRPSGQGVGGGGPVAMPHQRPSSRSVQRVARSGAPTSAMRPGSGVDRKLAIPTKGVRGAHEPARFLASLLAPCGKQVVGRKFRRHCPPSVPLRVADHAFEYTERYVRPLPEQQKTSSEQGRNPKLFAGAFQFCDARRAAWTDQVPGICESCGQESMHKLN